MDRPTISDVARLAGVSKKTVGRAIANSPLLSEETRTKVRAIIAEIGFAPEPLARPPAIKANPLVALVHDDPFAPALSEAQAGMTAALQGSDLALCVQYLGGTSKGALRAFGEFLERHRPSGVLLMPPLSAADDLAGLAWEYGCHCARLGAEPPVTAPGWFHTPDRRAAAEAVDWLVALGHRRIGLIAGPDHVRSARLRELGYLDAMAEHGLDRGPSLIASGDNSFESGFAAAELLLEISPRPSAILACSDEMAAGAIHAATARKIDIPAALSVLGFDDAPIAARICPPLTTVRVPVLEMAHAATLHLIDNERRDAEATEFALELIERETVAPAQVTTGEPAAFSFHEG